MLLYKTAINLLQVRFSESTCVLQLCHSYNDKVLVIDGISKPHVNSPKKHLVINKIRFAPLSLLYLSQSRQDPISRGCDHSITVRKLLLHCVKLLEETKYQHIAGHAICLLTELSLSESNMEYLHGFSDDGNGKGL